MQITANDLLLYCIEQYYCRSLSMELGKIFDTSENAAMRTDIVKVLNACTGMCLGMYARREF